MWVLTSLLSLSFHISIDVSATLPISPFVWRGDRGQMSPFISFQCNSGAVEERIIFIKLFIERSWKI